MSDNIIPFRELERQITLRSGANPVFCFKDGRRRAVTKNELAWAVEHGKQRYGDTWWAEKPRRCHT